MSCTNIAITATRIKCITVNAFRPECISMTANLVECGSVAGITFAGYSLLKLRGPFQLQVLGSDFNGDCFPIIEGTSLRMGGGMDMVVDVSQLKWLDVSGNHDDRGQYDIEEILAQGILLETIYFTGQQGGVTNALLDSATLWKAVLTNNGLTTLPVGGNTLTYLEITNNAITGSFDELLSPNLQVFLAGGNELTGEGTLPCSIIELDLSNNPITEESLKAIITKLDTCLQTGGTATLAGGNTYDPWKTSYVETKRLVDEKGWTIDGEPYVLSWVYSVAINFVDPVLANFYTAGNQVVVQRWLRTKGAQSMALDGTFVAGTITTSGGGDMTTQGFHATAGSPISSDPCASAVYLNGIYEHFLINLDSEFHLLANDKLYPADDFDTFVIKVTAGTPDFGCTNKTFFSDLGVPQDDKWSNINNWATLDFGQVFYDWLSANRSLIEGTPL